MDPPSPAARSHAPRHLLPLCADIHLIQTIFFANVQRSTHRFGVLFECRHKFAVDKVNQQHTVFSCLFVKQTSIIITSDSTGPRPPHTLGRLIWTCDQPVAKASTYTRQKNTETQRQTTKPRGEFEPTIPVNKRPRRTP
jgi:hypothetical protein